MIEVGDALPASGQHCLVLLASGAYATCVADNMAKSSKFRISGNVHYSRATHWLPIEVR